MNKKLKNKIFLKPGAVFYGRVSSKNAQNPEASYTRQMRDVRENIAKPRNIAIVKEYFDIESGLEEDRKYYQEMLADAANGLFSEVYVAMVDRLGRNVSEGLRAFELLEEFGIRVRIASNPELDPTTPAGRMMIGMLLAGARYESDVIGKRSLGGMVNKVLDGGWSWKTPDGYINKEERIPGSERDGSAGRYRHWVEIDPEQAKVWREAFDLLFKGLKCTHICDELHKKGYRLSTGTPFVQNRPDGSLLRATSTLSRVFHNPFYAAQIYVRNHFDETHIPADVFIVQGDWQPIITPAEFDAAQRILEKRDRHRDHQRKNMYLLQGIIFVQSENGAVHQMRCGTPNKQRSNGGNPNYHIKGLTVPCHIVDTQIQAQVRALQVEDDLLPKIRQTYLAKFKQVGKSPIDERNGLERKLKKLREDEANAAIKAIEMDLSAETWKLMQLKFKERRLQLETSIQALDSGSRNYVENLDAALHLFSEIAVLFEKADVEKQKALLKHVVERVVIDPMGTILRMDLHTPFSFINGLAADADGGVHRMVKTTAKSRTKTKSGPKAACSTWISYGGPTLSGNEPLSSLIVHDSFHFVELIAYPQRSALEPLLHD